jgi:hypothetical protein
MRPAAAFSLQDRRPRRSDSIDRSASELSQVECGPRPQRGSKGGRGIEFRLWSMEDVVALLDEHAGHIAPRPADRLSDRERSHDG